MPLDLDKLPPVQDVSFGFYSRTAESLGAPVLLYRLIDGQEAEGTAVCQDVEGKDYQFADKVFIGLVTHDIKVVRHMPKYDKYLDDPYPYYDSHDRYRRNRYSYAKDFYEEMKDIYIRAGSPTVIFPTAPRREEEILPPLNASTPF